MKYMMLMHARELLPAADMQASFQYMVSLAEELHESGELISTEGLGAPSQAKLVRAGDGSGHDDGPEVTDGPFPESKEFLIGYWLVDCDSPERAYEIAARISAVPGPGGIPANMPIEVREVMTHETADI